MIKQKTLSRIIVGGSAGFLLFAGMMATTSLRSDPGEQILTDDMSDTAVTKAASRPPSLKAEHASSDVDGSVTPIMVDDTRCTDGVAYELPSAQAQPQAVDVAGWYVNAGGDLAGTMAQLTVFDATEQSEGWLSEATHNSVLFPDGSAAVEWTVEDRIVATISVKRISPSELSALVADITVDAIDPEEFQWVERPARTAQLMGYSCRIDGDFVGVEVIVGDRPTQVEYAFNTDPTSASSDGSHAVLTFNRHDDQAINLRSVTAAEWRVLIERSRTETDQR